jgi:COMPASS component SWD1
LFLSKRKKNAYEIHAHSKIILALLSTGELFITDMRKEYRGRMELYDNPNLANNNHAEEKEEGEEDSSSVPPPPVRRDTKRYLFYVVIQFFIF